VRLLSFAPISAELSELGFPKIREVASSLYLGHYCEDGKSLVGLGLLHIGSSSVHQGKFTSVDGWGASMEFGVELTGGIFVVLCVLLLWRHNLIIAVRTVDLAVAALFLFYAVKILKRSILMYDF
jgi:hypothetical protein